MSILLAHALAAAFVAPLTHGRVASPRATPVMFMRDAVTGMTTNSFAHHSGTPFHNNDVYGGGMRYGGYGGYGGYGMSRYNNGYGGYGGGYGGCKQQRSSNSPHANCANPIH